MNRVARNLRVLGGIFVLLNLAAFFFPVTERIQKNYATAAWSQPDYIRELFRGSLPHGEEVVAVPLSQLQILWILAFMVLPLILALVAGIWGVIGGSRPMVGSILSFLVLAFYTGTVTTLGTVWPEAAAGQLYQRGNACWLHILFSACGAVAALLFLILTPGKTVEGNRAIPDLEPFRQQQIPSRYQVTPVDSGILFGPGVPRPEEIAARREGRPRGVMVGLSGMYAGAEIPLTSGEYIKLGRLNDNDLVFDGQKKISRNHCRIKWSAEHKKYFICDYSANGCFVNGSTDCLPQNLEINLEPGTVLAVGDSSNTFRLE